MKKILLLIISVLMISSIALLSACGNDNKDSGTSTSEEIKPKKIELSVDSAFNGTAGDEVSGKATYKTVTEALNALLAMDLTNVESETMYIAAGDYNEKIAIPASLVNLKFVGSTTGVTKITYGDYAGRIENNAEIGTDATATINIQADGFEASNIFFENSFDYFNPPAGVAHKQALAAYVKADKIIFNKCSFTGHQDTLETVSGRQYFKDCFIYGSTDFIFGNNAAVLFDNCEIKSRDRKNANGGYITAAKGNDGTNGQGVPTYGFVFKNCKLTADDAVIAESVALGRPWRADATVSYINCEMGAHISKKAYDGGNSKKRYVYMEGGVDSNNVKLKNEPQNAHFTEYGNTGAGAISEAVNGCTMLSKEQADLYTIQNIFATTNGAVSYVGEFNPTL